jgi:hypothetical protein
MLMLDCGHIISLFVLYVHTQILNLPGYHFSGTLKSVHSCMRTQHHRHYRSVKVHLPVAVDQGTHYIKSTHCDHMTKGYRLESQCETKVDDTVGNRDNARETHSQEQTCSHPSVGGGSEMLHHGSASLSRNMLVHISFHCVFVTSL